MARTRGVWATAVAIGLLFLVVAQNAAELAAEDGEYRAVIDEYVPPR